MEHSVTGPVIFGTIAAILTSSITYALAVREGTWPPKNDFEGFLQLMLIMTGGAATGILVGVALDKHFLMLITTHSYKKREKNALHP